MPNYDHWIQSSTCYFCNKAKKWKNITLKNGYAVPACGECYAMMEQNKKLAIERGYYVDGHYHTPSENFTKPFKVSGGDSMKVPKGNTGGNNLKVDFVTKRKITSLKITDEGELITYDPKDATEKGNTRLVIGVDYAGRQAGDADRWSLNNISRNALIDLWTDDTAKWIDKVAEINISGTGEYQHIVVDTSRTKE